MYNNNSMYNKMYNSLIRGSALLLCIASFAMAQKPVYRFLLVAGANDGGPGRPVLRYAESDAQTFAGVLAEMGGVSAEQRVLLKEPSPEALKKGFAELEKKLHDPRYRNGRREVVVYYSGHADESGLRLGKSVMPWPELRKQVDNLGAEVKIAVLDACGSGAITRLKGGMARPAFLSDASSDMKGYAFLTSSSEDESSQESDRLRGSFFTHALVSGLRGAADMSGDGKVTLGEAYQFAFNETLQKTQATSGGAQHPSRDMNLAGTGDVVMTDVRQTSAGLVLDADLDGRVFIRDNKGNLVAELYKSKGRSLELGLPAGVYQVQLEQTQFWSADGLQLKDGKKLRLAQGQFKAIRREKAMARGGDDSLTESNRMLDSARKLPFTMNPSVFYTHSEAPEHGMQLSLLVNNAEAEYVGSQVSLIANVAQKDMEGLQVNTFANVARGHLSGSQIGAGINVAKNMTGAQISSGFNIADSVEGVQVASGMNITYGAIYGLQAGLLNISADGGRGAQGGILNISADSLSGGQGGVLNIGTKNSTLQGGVLNIAQHAGKVQGGVANIAGSVDYVQGGVFNVAGYAGHVQGGVFNAADSVSVLQGGVFNAARHAGKVQGGVTNIASRVDYVQVGVFNAAGNVSRFQGGVFNVAGSVGVLQGGLFNIVGRTTGRQIGLINIAGHSDKTPIGLINIVGNGIFDATSYLDETGGWGVSLHTGTPWLYTLFEYNQTWNSDGNWPRSWGLGLGTRFGMRGTFFNLDYAFLNVYDSKPDNFSLIEVEMDNESTYMHRNLHKVRLGAAYQILPGVALNGGMSMNSLVASNSTDLVLTPKGDYHWNWTFGRYTTRCWPGAYAGLTVGMF